MQSTLHSSFFENGNFVSHDDIKLKRLSNKNMYAIDTLSVRRDTTTTMHDFEMDPRWQSVSMQTGIP